MESVGGVAQGGGNEEMKILIGKRGNEDFNQLTRRSSEKCVNNTL